MTVFARPLRINQQRSGKRTASGAQRHLDNHRVHGTGDVPHGLFDAVCLLRQRELPIPLRLPISILPLGFGEASSRLHRLEQDHG